MDRKTVVAACATPCRDAPGGTVAQQARATANRRRISGGHALVLLAVWTAILPFTWVSVPWVGLGEVDPAVVVVHGFIVAVTATPLVFARLGRVALRRASLVASLLLFAILPVGLFLGLAFYLPAAVLLLAAGLADPQSRPQLTTALVAAGVVVGVVTTVVFAGEFSREWLRFHADCQGGYLTGQLLTHEEFRVQLEHPIDDPHSDPLLDQIDGLITTGKFCCTRWGRVRLDSSRRPVWVRPAAGQAVVVAGAQDGADLDCPPPDQPPPR